MPQLNLRRQSVRLIALVVLLMLIVAVAGGLDSLELNAVNTAFQLRGPEPPKSSIVIVAIDDISFGETGLQWPWPRTYFAQMVDRLAAGGAKLIAFDVFFFEPEQFKPATYTVQGEEIRDIAEHYSLAIPDLLTANGLDNSGSVCGGQTLIIPTHPAQEHIVARDTLEVLAARYQTDVPTLMNVNGLKAPCEIRPRQLLLMPVRGPLTYTVIQGDDVARVARDFQVNPLAIVGPDGQPARDPLSAGQTLTVQFGDAALAASIKAAGNVVLNGEIRTEQQAGGLLRVLRQPINILREGAVGFGITNFERDADSAAHSILGWNRANEKVYYSWPIVAAGHYTGQAPEPEPRADEFRLGEQTVPLNQQFLRINFRGPEQTIPTYSALQVVNGDLPLSVFKDKVVFIGSTSVSLQDVYPTPFSLQLTTPGVEIMANAFDTVLSGEYISLRSGVCAERPADGICPLPQRFMMLLSILLSGLMGLGLIVIRQPTRAIATLVGLLVAGLALWLGAFLLLRAELPVIAPLLTLLLAFAVPAVERAVSEELEKRRVRGIFEMFISPEMVGQLIEQGVDAMRGKRAELTILFSDIRGFTTMSEKMTPEELVNVLNEYLGAMTDVIHKHGGTVDKYEGDLVMAFFGAPIWYADHAERAVRCSIDMRVELDRLRKQWAEEGKPSKLEMGIGLNTAEVFVGLVGSGRRVNYTVMGDGVNLASRVQDLTKDLKWPLLITEFTYERVKDQFDTEFGESRLVKGKTVPVGMYKVIREKGAPEERSVRPLFT